MKFKTVEIARVKKFYRVNRIIKLSVKLSEAIILFIVQQHYAENRRERKEQRERERRNHGISNRAKAMVTERETTQRHPKYLKIV